LKTERDQRRAEFEQRRAQRQQKQQ
jgi:hypothetical protein